MTLLPNQAFKLGSSIATLACSSSFLQLQLCRGKCHETPLRNNTAGTVLAVVSSAFTNTPPSAGLTLVDASKKKEFQPF